ncbi:hypothetical protein [Bacillus velezensis]|uniref:hypothetical protein n=1 Tax=Bacillus velezensis TaxID=492670 RepID=UPI003896E67C
MSLNAMHRNIMIYSDTEEKAINKLESIVSELDEEILINRPGFVQTPTKKIEARKFSDYCRGYRYTRVYVDISLRNDPETLGWILMKLVPPFYYKNVEYDDEYNWEDHVIYFK